MTLRPCSSAGRLVTMALAVVLVFAVPMAAPAEPSTPQIEAKRAEAQSAQNRLEDLAAELELRAEEYYAIAAELEQIRADIAVTRDRLAAADIELAARTEQLESRAAGIYRGGNVDMLEVLLGTTSFEDFLTRMDWLTRVNRGDAEIVEGVKEARELVRQAEEALSRREAEQVVLRGRAEVKKREVEEAVAGQQAFVAGLNSELNKLIAEEQERQRRIAEEAARKAAEEAARRAALQQAASRPAASTARVAAEPTPVAAGALGGGHPEVVAVGMRFVGVPYVWGGSSPSGFDCSGLTSYVYAQVGITLPRTSRSQYRTGGHIPADRIDLLAPGDLVFFGHGGDPGSVHHVGIYVGSGSYLHAPYTGASVRVDSLMSRISSRGDYVGASRF